MAYKAQYRPIQALIGTEWREFSQGRTPDIPPSTI